MAVQYINNIDALSTDYKITGITNDISNNFIIYYGYYNSSSKGFITDYKFQVLQLIKQYSGGNKFACIILFEL